MAIITRQNVKAYIEGWKETHEDEELDEAVAEDCLQDEALTITNKLLEDDADLIARDPDFLRTLLCMGFDGYDNMSYDELCNELEERGLEI